MSVESRPIPTNLMAWPKHQDLVNGYKTLVYWLWSNTHISNAGVMIFPIAEAGAATSNPQGTIIDMLDEFERRRIIARDVETGEIFVLDWFRFHRFADKRIFALRDDLKRIQSPKIRSIVDQSMGYLPREGEGKVRDKESASDDAPPHAPALKQIPKTALPTAKRKSFEHLHGIECWDAAERDEILALVAQFGPQIVEQAAMEARLRRPDGRALLSNTRPLLIQAAQLKAAREAHANFEAKKASDDSVALAAAKNDRHHMQIGQQLLTAHRRRRRGILT